MGLRSEFHQYGFATIDYPPRVIGLVQEMMNSWKEFCSLPLETKSKYVYSGDTGSGYEFKDEPGPTKDRKENFHFTIRELPRIDMISRSTGMGARFVDGAEALLRGIRAPLCGFVGRLEQVFNLTGVHDEVNASWDTWFLRLLHYPAGSQPGQIIAAQHVDKVGLTMYLGETTLGVQYCNHDLEWVDMPVLPGKIIITPNMQMQYKTRGELKALCHRVVANEESAQKGRYSMVCFVSFLRTPQYNKSKYGRLQDMPLAFNYHMAHDEFSHFFA